MQQQQALTQKQQREAEAKLAKALKAAETAKALHELKMLAVVKDPNGFEDLPGSRQSVQGVKVYDSRAEIRSLKLNTDFGSKAERNSRSVAIVVEKDQLQLSGDGVYQLDLRTTLGARYKLCPENPLPASHCLVSARHLWSGQIK